MSLGNKQIVLHGNFKMFDRCYIEPVLWENQSWILSYDNVLYNTSLLSAII